MPDAPAAPVGASPTGPQGAAPGVTAPPAAGKNGNGKVNGSPGAKTAAETTPPPAPFRYKDKLNVFGEEIDVDMSQEDLRRELQIARASRKEIQAARDAQKKAQQLFEADPEAFLRERGLDPDEWASQRLAARARMGMMTPEQREAAEARAEANKHKAELERIQQEGQQKEEAALVEQHRQRNVAALQEAFKSPDVNLPFTYETTYIAAETARLALEAGIDLTADPKLWAMETAKRTDSFAEHYLAGLDRISDNAAFLSRVAKLGGGKFIARVLAAKLEEFNKGQGIPGASTRRQREAPPPEPEKRQYIDEHEWRRRVNARVAEADKARGR